MPSLIIGSYSKFSNTARESGWYALFNCLLLDGNLR